MSGSPVPDIRSTFGAAFVGLLALWFDNYADMDILLVTGSYLGVRQTDKSQALLEEGPKSTQVLHRIHNIHGYLTHNSVCLRGLLVRRRTHTVLHVLIIVRYLVLNFGNFQSLDSSMWAMSIQVVVSILVGASVQLYYTRRVYIVSRSIFIPILIVALVVLGSSFGFLFTAKEFILQRFANFHSLTWISCVGMTTSALADLLIAAAMCWSLYRRKTGYARTDSIIMTLMAYSINSGLLTSVLAGAMTISFIVSPSSLVSLAFYWAMSKCYTNSLLAMLNCRDHVRDRSTADNPDNAFNLSSIRIEPPSETYGSKSGQPGVSVTIQRSTTSDLGRNKSDHGVEPTFKVPKQVWVQVSPILKAKVERRSQAHKVLIYHGAIRGRVLSSLDTARYPRTPACIPSVFCPVLTLSHPSRHSVSAKEARLQLILNVSKVDSTVRIFVHLPPAQRRKRCLGRRQRAFRSERSEDRVVEETMDMPRSKRPLVGLQVYLVESGTKPKYADIIE
ncbi:hypothetical protein EDB92DRAFT_2102046 [Lactarius akahatsu]|uniref:DUF6534 domain-containing protein n=1 Tax=Lactarius akahatsu TaxID=416441 RepID=A0AAD4LNT2_9AGAM|nr:hypothetical protein EDB92DRAFT_2102046 [Lactarius akahatsu]